MDRTFIYFLIIFLLMITGCKTAGHRYVDIKPPEFGAQFIPEQLNTLLNNTGFYRIEFSANVEDPGATPEDTIDIKKGMVISAANKLLMRYQHKMYTTLQVNVTIEKYKGAVNLEFYDTGNTQLSDEAVRIYNQFIKNLKSGIYDENDFTES